MTLFTPGLGHVGLGLRREFLAPLLAVDDKDRLPDFLEIAPENWMGFGGRHARDLRQVSERFPMACHGLSLNIGGFAPLDLDFLRSLRDFLDIHQALIYSEHLSYTGDEGHLYDLLPLPMTRESADHVIARVIQAQDILGRRLVLENVSTYAQPGMEMSEPEFLAYISTGADCELLLDINNVHVNCINHDQDPQGWLAGFPTHRIRYGHVAGHFVERADLCIDTHGAPVAESVWRLLAFSYARCGVYPTVLERDFNIPPLHELLDEVSALRRLQASGAQHAA